MGSLIDSSVLIAAERGRFDLEAFFTSNAGEKFFISAITASELLHGAHRGHEQEREKRRVFVFDTPLASRCHSD